MTFHIALSLRILYKIPPPLAMYFSIKLFRVCGRRCILNFFSPATFARHSSALRASESECPPEVPLHPFASRTIKPPRQSHHWRWAAVVVDPSLPPRMNVSYLAEPGLSSLRDTKAPHMAQGRLTNKSFGEVSSASAAGGTGYKR